jgi:AraC family transcriptional regulator of adaptative response / DNA-3-methyladenine glycosylase II
VPLDPDICYRAVRSRDTRFDGRFFTAVLTTGIYCRPICPARLPARGNVRFYDCAAAAEEAGFRPCRRCRPETAPGTPAWSGTSATVTRALRLIAEGALDGPGQLDDLADRLGVTGRHLRRLFDTHLGASPIAVAQARRVHFAKMLLDNTPLPITEIAMSSGFSSVRRFNTVFSKTFGRSPREVRESRPARTPLRTKQGLELHLSFREPFDWRAMLEFLALRAIPGVEAIEEGHYRRILSMGSETGLIEVSRVRGRSQLELWISPSLSRYVLPIAERVRSAFDLAADSRIIEAQLSKDPLLREIVEQHPGTRVPGAWNPFEVAVRAILGQQVSVKGATTLSGRLVEAYGVDSGSEDAGCRWLFPSAARLSRARLDRVGLTNARARALRALASAVNRGGLRFDGAGELDATIESLTSLPGIGPWTAHYIAMRSCGEPDAFPSGDLALRKVAKQLDPEIDDESKLLERATCWRPWRAYAAMFIWRYHATRSSAEPDAKVRRVTAGLGAGQGRRTTRGPAP